jgi:hypothetical protein
VVLGAMIRYSSSGVRTYLNITGASQEKTCLSRKFVKNCKKFRSSQRKKHGNKNKHT